MNLALNTTIALHEDSQSNEMAKYTSILVHVESGKYKEYLY